MSRHDDCAAHRQHRPSLTSLQRLILVTRGRCPPQHEDMQQCGLPPMASFMPLNQNPWECSCVIPTSQRSSLKSERPRPSGRALRSRTRVCRAAACSCSQPRSMSRGDAVPELGTRMCCKVASPVICQPFLMQQHRGSPPAAPSCPGQAGSLCQPRTRIDPRSIRDEPEALTDGSSHAAQWPSHSAHSALSTA